MKLLLENWRKYLVEDKRQQAAAYLDKIFNLTHASGRPISKAFNKISEDNTQITPVAIVNELTPSYLRAFIEKYKNISEIAMSEAKMNIDMAKIKDPREIAVINSILLYTAGNVASVRNPEKYTDSDADTLGSPVQGHGYGDAKYVDSRVSPDDVVEPGDLYKDRVKSGIKVPQYLLKPSKELYTIANYVLNQLGVLSNSNNPAVIYRGMGLPQEVIDNLKEGSVFNNSAISSWTSSKDVAESFDKFNMAAGPYCQFIIENPTVGTDISNLSGFPQEEEFILGKKIRIVNIRKKDRTSYNMGIWTYFVCEIVQ